MIPIQKMSSMAKNQQKTPKKKSKAGGIIYTLVVVVILIGGLGVLLYPTFSNWWNERRNAKLATNYDQVVGGIPKEDLSEYWRAAREYNAQHGTNVFVDVFDREEYILTHPYDTLLNPAGNGIMGSIEIPKIDQKLAIYHGTGAWALERGAGHVEGTSLPIGGPSTHSAISAHRGLPSAKFFTDLDQMEVGDEFYLHILDETLAYKIDQINIVEPTDASDLTIVDGEDYCTLITCHPYGVNSHRMLVRGVRTEFIEEHVEEQAAQQEMAPRDRRLMLLVIGIAAVFGLIILFNIIDSRKRKKKAREEAAKKSQTDSQASPGGGETPDDKAE